MAKKSYPVVSWSYRNDGLKVWIQTSKTVTMSVMFQEATIEDRETLSGEFENPRRGQASFVLKISPDKQSGEISFTEGISPSDLICGNVIPSVEEEQG